MTIDKGLLLITRLDDGSIQVTVRSPGENKESKIVITYNEWKKMSRF